jgi:hypothetical protein
MIFSRKTKREIPTDIKEIFGLVENLEKKVAFLEKELEQHKKASLSNISKIEIKRFNPYKDMGSDHSVSITMLDGNNNGFILTSLYAREDMRIFTKPINNGISEYPLLKEEEQILKKAIND